MLELKNISPQIRLQSSLLRNKIEDDKVQQLCLTLTDQDIQPMFGILENMKELKLLTNDNVKAILNLKNEVNISDAEKEHFYDKAQKLFSDRCDIYAAHKRPVSQREFHLILFLLNKFSPSAPRHEEVKQLYFSMATDGLTFANCARNINFKNSKNYYLPFDTLATELERIFPKPTKNSSFFFQFKTMEVSVTIKENPAPAEKIIPGIS